MSDPYIICAVSQAGIIYLSSFTVDISIAALYRTGDAITTLCHNYLVCDVLLMVAVEQKCRHTRAVRRNTNYIHVRN